MGTRVFKNVAEAINKYATVKGFEQVSQLIFDDDFIQEWIIETIQERLETQGRTAELEQLRTDMGKSQKFGGKGGFYSKTTEFLKGTTGPVTLKDTGEFYNSWKLVANKTYYTIKADFEKEDGHMFRNFQDSFSGPKDFEGAIVRMSEEEKELFFNSLFIPRFKARFIKDIQDAIRKSN